MILKRLQDLIGGIYDVSIAHNVYDFLVTDRERLPPAARVGAADEELIVAEGADGGGGEVRMSLNLDPALLERLRRSEEHTSELQSQSNLVCRLLLEKKKTTPHTDLL